MLPTPESSRASTAPRSHDLSFRLLLRLPTGPLRLAVGHHPVVLGAARDCELRVDHPSVSERHARLQIQGETLEIVDLGSSNGTYLKGRRVKGPSRASAGERLTFGAVSGELERLDDTETRAAYSLRRDDPPAGTEHAASQARGHRMSSALEEGRETLAAGALEIFALQTIPALLQVLSRHLGPQIMAERLGAALWSGLPTTGVEIHRISDRGPRLCFSAGEIADSEGLTIRAEDRRHAVRLSFRSRASVATFEALPGLGLQLLELSVSRRPKNSAAGRKQEAPAMPDPPSLSRRMVEIYDRAARIAGSRVNVLILGESGTGKDVLSRYIHRAGPGAGAPYVPLNCAALPKELLEAELFGIEKGVATGVDARVGKFESAHGGTIFLDEVGDMAPETQAKILRVLQERKVYRLGGSRAYPIDIQVIAATNRDLDIMVRRGTFRADLFYRLAGWEIQLPPLRERREDIPNLTIHFFEQEARHFGLQDVGISVAAMKALRTYDWPGNIRQLQHEVARGALLLSEGDLLETRHLRPAVSEAGAASSNTLEATLERAERRRIEEAIDESDGSLDHIAAILGISRSTLYRRMRHLGIDRDPGSPQASPGKPQGSAT